MDTTKLKLLLEEYNIQLLPYYHGGRGIQGVRVKGPHGEAKIGVRTDPCSHLEIFTKALILSSAYLHGESSILGFVGWVVCRPDGFFVPRDGEEHLFHPLDLQYKIWGEGIDLAHKLIPALTEDFWRMLLNAIGVTK